eukprot:scaffold17.g433.t1
MAARVVGLAKSVSFVARLAAAALDGVVFTLGERGRQVVLAAELVAFAAETGGPARPLAVAAGAAAATVAARAAWVLTRTLPSLPQEAAAPPLESVWDWEPQDSEAMTSWHVLRALVRTAGQVQRQYPVLGELLAQPALAGAELPRRLYSLYALHEARARRGEELEPSSTAPLASATRPAPPALLRQLAYYRPFAAELAYDRPSDAELSAALAERGFGLLAAAFVPDLDSGCPAYYLALSAERREVVLGVRGTYSPEDLFADLLSTALPGRPIKPSALHTHTPRHARAGAPLGVGEAQAHRGMVKAALFLGARFRGLLGLLAAQGVRITLVGHSLGGGVAALLATYLKHELGLGPGRLAAWAFEAPACMDLEAARDSAGESARARAKSRQRCFAGSRYVVTTTIHGDDVVPRLTAETFALLLEELAQPECRLGVEDVVHHLGQLMSRKLPTALGGSGDSDAEERWQQGRPQHRCEGRDRTTDGSESRAEAALRGAAGEVRGREGTAPGGAEQEAELVKVRVLEFEAHDYHPHVPGAIVYIHRLPQQQAQQHEQQQQPVEKQQQQYPPPGSAAVASSEPAVGFALLDTRHPVLRRVRLTSTMIADHAVDVEGFISRLERGAATAAQGGGAAGAA